MFLDRSNAAPPRLARCPLFRLPTRRQHASSCSNSACGCAIRAAVRCPSPRGGDLDCRLARRNSNCAPTLRASIVAIANSLPAHDGVPPLINQLRSPGSSFYCRRVKRRLKCPCERSAPTRSRTSTQLKYRALPLQQHRFYYFGQHRDLCSCLHTPTPSVKAGNNAGN